MQQGQIHHFFNTTLPYLPGAGKDKIRNLYKDNYLTSYASTSVIPYVSYTSDFNFSKFIENVIRNAGVNAELYRQVSSSVDNLDNLYPEEPELTQLKFERNDKGILVRDGQELNDAKLEADLTQAGICYGTGIKDNGKGNCDDVYKCLLDLKPGDISRCADELADEDLFDVATRDVQMINPRIMKLILQNLGVKMTNQNGMVVCESYDSWLSKTSIRKVVLKNRNLARYIKTIVDTIRSNPVVLNPKQKLNKLYGLDTFKTPTTMQSKSEVPSNLQDLLLYTKNISTTLPMPMYPDNLRFIMSGGGELSENAAQLKKLFNILFDELDKAGVPLVDNDQKRINDTIEKMGKLELALPRLLEDLRVYTDLIKLIDEKEKDNTVLDDFKDIRNNKTELADLVNKVNKKIQANINKQNLIFQVLYNQVQVPLIARLGF